MASRLAVIAAHGSLDAAYPPLILATSAVAMDMEVAIFFTFFGLEILKKGQVDKLQFEPVANPAMPVHIPNIVGVMPGMTAVATKMMNDWIEDAKVSKLSELLDMAKEMGVRLIACQMTMDLMHVQKEELIDGIEVGGAATFLEYASQDAITLSF